MNKRKLVYPVLFTGLSLPAFCQDTSMSDSPIVDAEQLWYLETPVWIGAGVILLIVLIALFRHRPHKGGLKTLPKGRFSVKKIKKNHSNI